MRTNKMSTSTTSIFALSIYFIAGLILTSSAVTGQGCPATGSSITVVNTNDSGAGSLRAAMNCANARTDLDLIRFEIPGVGPRTIFPTSELPTITDEGVIIDATTQFNWQIGDVVISGAALGGNTTGITIAANNVEIYGLRIESFRNSAIDFSEGTLRSGIRIGGEGRSNVLTCALGVGEIILSGNTADQLGFDNFISHNYIGTSPAGEVLGGLNGIRCTRTGLIINDNVISYLAGAAILLDFDVKAIISQNLVSCNDGGGIVGNVDMNLFSPKPVINSASLDGIFGTSEEDSFIEVFIGSRSSCLDCQNGVPQGAIYLGNTVSNGQGEWILPRDDFIVIPAEGEQIIATSLFFGVSSEYSDCAPFAQGVCVNDMEPPLIEPIDINEDGSFGDDEVVLVNTDNCQFDFLIPEPLVTDNCDAIPTVSARIFFGPDYGTSIGPFLPGQLAAALPVGDHRLVYDAVDNNENVDMLTINLLVRDTIAPVITTNLPDTVVLTANADCVADFTFDLRIFDNCINDTRRYLAFLQSWPPPPPGEVPLVIVGDTLFGPAILSVDTTITLRDNIVGEYTLIIVAQDVNLNYSDFDLSPVFVRIIPESIAPPECIDPPSVVLAPVDGDFCGGEATIDYAELVIPGASDCSGPLKYAIYPEAETQAAGFSPNVADSSLLLTCNDVGAVPLRVYGIDSFGINNFCTTEITVAAGQGISCVAPPVLTTVSPAAQCVVGSGAFDLTLADELLVGTQSVYTVAWFEDETMQQFIANPTSFAPAAAPFTVFARAENQNCFSNVIPVVFAAENETLVGFSSLPQTLCTNDGIFTLPEEDQGVTGQWFLVGTGPVEEIDPLEFSGQSVNLVFSVDPEFCASNFTTTVSITNSPVAVMTSPGDTVCRDSIISLTYAGANAGAVNYSWSSDPDALVSGGNERTVDFRWDTNGPAEVSLVTEAGGCFSEVITNQFIVGECSPCDSLINCVPQNGQIASVVIPNTLTTSTQQEICLPVLQDGFTNVVGFGFGVSWDPFVLAFQAIRQINPEITGFSEITGPFAPQTTGINTSTAAADGTLTAFWSGTGANEDCTAAENFSLAPAKSLFSICFTVENAIDGDVTGVNFSTVPQESFILTVNNCRGPSPESLSGFDAVMNFSLACEHPDFPALADFFTATNGEEWSENEGWSTNAQDDTCTPCQWFGVTCNEQDRVIALDLDLNNLTGQLPATIGELTELRELNLRENSIGGAIPDGLGTLRNLELIDLDLNGFTGTVPAEVWTLPLLRELELWGNQLEGEIPSLGQLVALEFIDLHDNGFSGPLPTISPAQQPSLLDIDFADNNFAGEIPDNYGSLGPAAGLDLSGNPLISGCVPDSFGDYCGTDAVIDLTGNPLLPYEGVFASWCDGNISVGANCDNGTGTINDTITVDCDCVEVEIIDCSEVSISYIFDDQNSSQPTCLEPESGSLSAIGIGGVEPYSYLWSNGETTSMIDNLPEGIYTLTITDANDCTNNDVLIVPEVAIPAPTLTCPGPISEVLPFGIDSILLDIPAPGAEGCSLEGLAYTITGATTAAGVGAVGPQFFNVGVSEITYNLGDSVCTTLVTIDQLGQECNALVVSNVNVVPSLCGEANGAINFALTGASEDDSFSWSPENTELNPSGLAPGVYVLRVVDTDGACSFSLGFLVRAELEATVFCSATDASSETEADGIIRLGIDLETVTLPLVASYTGAGISGSVEITETSDSLVEIPGVPAGVYTWTLTEPADGCETSCTVEVGFPVCDGVIQGTVLDANICPGSEFVWNNESYVETGVYLDTIITVQGCDSAIVLNLNVASEEDVTISGSRFICNGNPAELFAQGAVAYQWRGDNGFTAEGDLVFLPPGPYEMEATTVNGCTFSYALEVFEREPPRVTFTEESTLTLCEGQSGVLRLQLGANEVVEWLSDPDGILLNRTDSLSISNSGRSYRIAILDTITGCAADTTVFIEREPEVFEFVFCPPNVEILLNLGEQDALDLSWELPVAVSACGSEFDFSGEAGVVGLNRDTTIVYRTSADGGGEECSFEINVVRTDTMTFYVDEANITQVGDDTLRVPISVNNFDGGVAFQIHLELDDIDGAGVLSELVLPVNTLLETGLVTELVNEHTLNIVWLTNDPQRTTFPDSTQLFEVLVIVAGGPGSCVRMSFAETLPEVTMAFREGVELFPSTQNGEVCLPALADIGGEIFRYTADFSTRPVPNVEVSLENQNVVSRQDTPADGTYLYSDQLRGGKYEITPFLDRDYLNGVSILDVVLIRNMVIGFINNSSPVSPIQYVAANLQADDCRISVRDLFIEMRMLAGVFTTFPGVNSYRFVDAAHEFPDVNAIRSGNQEWCIFPESIVIDPLNQDSLNNDFVAVKMGDVSLNARDPSPSGLRAIAFESQLFADGDTINVPVNIPSDLAATDLLWNFDPRYLDLLPVQEANADGFKPSDFVTANEKGTIRQVWTDLTGKAWLRFVTRGSGQLKEYLELDERSLGADESGNLYYLKLTEDRSLSGHNWGAAIRPNPFRDQVSVVIDQSPVADFELTVYGASGQRMVRYNVKAQKGLNTFNLNHNFGPAGLYYLRVVGPDNEQWLKMVKQ